MPVRPWSPLLLLDNVFEHLCDSKKSLLAGGREREKGKRKRKKEIENERDKVKMRERERRNI